MKYAAGIKHELLRNQHKKIIPTVLFVIYVAHQKQKKKHITFTNSFLKPGLLFLLALLFEIKMNGCREDIVGGRKTINK